MLQASFQPRPEGSCAVHASHAGRPWYQGCRLNALEFKDVNTAPEQKTHSMQIKAPYQKSSLSFLGKLS